MKILIIGSEGFIGNHCVEYFQSKSNAIFGCDLLDLKGASYNYFKISRFAPNFDEIFMNYMFDVCINAAGSGSVPLSIEHPYADFEANSIDTFKLLEAIRLYNKHCKYVNISSAAVYGNPHKLPVNENDSIQPLSPYGWHKYYAELICKEYHTLYNIPTFSMRPFSVYGPGLKKQLFWDIYQKALNSKQLNLFGTGKESRDFIYITDLINCIDLILNEGSNNGEVYNAASGIEITIEEAAYCFVKHFDSSIKVGFTGNLREGDPNNWLADITAIKNIGYNPIVSLEEGLKKYCLWLKT